MQVTHWLIRERTVIKSGEMDSKIFSALLHRLTESTGGMTKKSAEFPLNLTWVNLVPSAHWLAQVEESVQLLVWCTDASVDTDALQIFACISVRNYLLEVENNWQSQKLVLPLAERAGAFNAPQTDFPSRSQPDKLTEMMKLNIGRDQVFLEGWEPTSPGQSITRGTMMPLCLLEHPLSLRAP